MEVNPPLLYKAKGGGGPLTNVESLLAVNTIQKHLLKQRKSENNP